MLMISLCFSFDFNAIVSHLISLCFSFAFLCLRIVYVFHLIYYANVSHLISLCFSFAFYAYDKFMFFIRFLCLCFSINP